jgi:hypothetical protein
MTNLNEIPPIKWPEPRPKYEPPVAPVILVRMREATQLEVPPAANAYGLRLLAQGLVYGRNFRFTYAQGGPERPQPQTGVCGKCETTTTLVLDGSLRSHNKPRPKKCIGSGDEVREQDGVLDGKAKVLKWMCPQCWGMFKVTKKFTLTSHQPPVVPCEGIGLPPERLLPIQTLEPVRSLVLRIQWATERRAVAVWHDDEFVEAWCWLLQTARDEVGGELIDIGIGPKCVGVREFEAYLAAQGLG